MGKGSVHLSPPENVKDRFAVIKIIWQKERKSLPQYTFHVLRLWRGGTYGTRLSYGPIAEGCASQRARKE